MILERSLVLHLEELKKVKYVPRRTFRLFQSLENESSVSEDPGVVLLPSPWTCIHQPPRRSQWREPSPRKEILKPVFWVRCPQESMSLPHSMGPGLFVKWDPCSTDSPEINTFSCCWMPSTLSSPPGPFHLHTSVFLSDPSIERVYILMCLNVGSC